MIIRNYDALPEEARFVRETVFVLEQGFKEEFDSIDNIATHLVAFENDEPVAVGRFYYDEEQDLYFIGRVAVLKNYRGSGVGGKIIAEAERLIQTKGGKAVALHSQVQAKAFYEKQGYCAYGEIDYDEHCPHIWLKKEL